MQVKTQIPDDQYRHLNRLAVAHNTTVGVLVAELVHRGLTKPKRTGRRSAYTPRIGEDIWADRNLNMSWSEIARKYSIDRTTARAWGERYEQEERNRIERVAA